MNVRDWAAIGFLTAALLAPLAYLTRLWLRSEFGPHQAVARWLSMLIVRIQWRTTVEGKLDLPPGVGAILICNHRSSLDPFFVQAAASRKIRWLVAREYVAHPAFRWFLLGVCEVIPVGRDGVDTAATKAALRTVGAGGLVGMLPEGRINTTDELLLPVRPGAAMIALKLRVPVIPCYIDGAPYDRTPWSPLLMTARCTLRFGPPIDLSDLHDREQEPGVSAEAITRCMRGVATLAGRPDYEPRLAGRSWKPGAVERSA